jgi:hypothetical protein
MRSEVSRQEMLSLKSTQAGYTNQSPTYTQRMDPAWVYSHVSLLCFLHCRSSQWSKCQMHAQVPVLDKQGMSLHSAHRAINLSIEIAEAWDRKKPKFWQLFAWQIPILTDRDDKLLNLGIVSPSRHCVQCSPARVGKSGKF